MFKLSHGGIYLIRNTNLLKNNKKFYNGLFERPTQSLISHIQIIGIIDTFEYFSGFFSNWTCSIALTSAFIRLLQIPTYWLIKDLTVYHYFTPNIMRKWFDKIVLNDFHIDMNRYRVDQFDKKRYLHFYDTNYLLSWVPQVILMFNNFRSLNVMCKGVTEYPQFYPQFNKDVLNWNLATHDSFFIFPIFIFINNFFLLKIIKHPWLINYSTEGNKVKLIYLAFGTSIFSIFWPKCYCISWLSYSLTHIIIRMISDQIYKRSKFKKTYEYHVEKNYKYKMEELYNNSKR